MTDGLSHSLLLEILNRVGVIEKQNERHQAQNEMILAAQERADASRSRTHERIDDLTTEVHRLASAQAASAVAQESFRDRLEVVEPIVTMLKEEKIDRRAVRRACARAVKFLRSGYGLAGSVAGAGATAWFQWEAIRTAIARVLGFKIGGG